MKTTKSISSYFWLVVSLAVVIEGCQIVKQGVNDTVKQQIVEAHNKLRQKVAMGQQAGQPAASNMRKLVWDDGLAATAQKLANGCEFEHDTAESSRTAKYSEPGQNLAEGSTTNHNAPYDYSNGVQRWYDEVTKCNFNPKLVSKYVFGECYGHYVEVVWAENEAVGCGYVAYRDGKWMTHFLVCNYGPGGNVKNGVVYKTGPACSACSKGCSNYSGLCN